MGNPTSVTDYPPFTGATGKRDMIRAIRAAIPSHGRLIGVLYQIALTNLNDLGDKSTIYAPEDNFESA